jgi:hypothetical protein
MLSVLYAECPLCWVSFMLSVLYAECPICWVSFMLIVLYAEFHGNVLKIVCNLKRLQTIILESFGGFFLIKTAR